MVKRKDTLGELISDIKKMKPLPSLEDRVSALEHTTGAIMERLDDISKDNTTRDIRIESLARGIKRKNLKNSWWR